MERGIRTYASVEDFVEDRLPDWAVLLGKGHFDRLKGEVGCVGVWCGRGRQRGRDLTRNHNRQNSNFSDDTPMVQKCEDKKK